MKKSSFLAVITIIFVLSLMKINVQAYSSFYYDNQVIRAGLISISNTSMSISINGDFKLGDVVVKSGTKYTLALSGGKIWANDGISSIGYDSLNFEPQSKDSYIIITSVKGSTVYTRNYKGSMNFTISNGAILPINRINIEEYLKGVIGYEMSNSYPIEALKAQAVVARTYAATKISILKEYDVVDTTANQVYWGFNSIYFNVDKAVNDTKGEFVTYGGYLISEALYSASDGGYTEDAANVWGNSISYLKAKKDDFDSYSWTQTISKKFIADKLGTTDVNSININLNTITTYESGRISNLSIDYKNSTGVQQSPKVLNNDAARTFFGVKSALYTVTYNATSGDYTFSGNGYGHGLGMSQIGAKSRANSGQTYKQIIEFYYNGAIVKSYSASLGTVTASNSEIFTGDNLTVSAQGLNGSGNYLFKYIVEKDAQVIETRDYSSNSSLILQPSKSGSYKVSVFFKDSLSKDEYEDMKYVTFSVIGLADVNLDKTVNIYDLVIISKNLQKTKANTQDWNSSLDLVKDDVINILDLAKAAQNYNKEY